MSNFNYPKIRVILDPKNERGIFLLSIVRGLLMKLLYNRKYDKIDGLMSESNIGARKNRSARDHIWILNGIISDHTRSMKLPAITL